MAAEPPQDGQIRICVDSGANSYSANYAYVEPKDIGFDSIEDWREATDDEKLKAVQDYFYTNGNPEWSWSE